MTTYKVTVLPMNIEFDVQGGESVLAAAIRQSVELPYRCRGGHCCECVCRILEGEGHYPKLQPLLTDREQAEGLALSCQLHAQSDLLLKFL